MLPSVSPCRLIHVDVVRSVIGGGSSTRFLLMQLDARALHMRRGRCYARIKGFRTLPSSLLEAGQSSSSAALLQLMASFHSIRCELTANRGFFYIVPVSPYMRHTRTFPDVDNSKHNDCLCSFLAAGSCCAHLLCMMRRGILYSQASSRRSNFRARVIVISAGLRLSNTMLLSPYECGSAQERQQHCPSA